jgi:cytochrome c oxidase subunit 2
VIDRWLPAAASAHASSLDAVLRDIHWHIFAIFAVWLAVFVVALIKFRSGANAEPRPEGARGLWAAIAIGAVVAGDVFILATQALPAWSARVAPPPAGATPIEIRVTGEQFAWNIHYPGPDGVFGRTDNTLISASNPVGIDREDAAAGDDVGLLNILTLPVDRTIVIQLTSRDVVHSFTLNEMRVRQDAVPGLVSRVWFTPTSVGDWEIACSQLCGLGHYRMRGEYHVVSAEGWERWMTDEQERLRR